MKKKIFRVFGFLLILTCVTGLVLLTSFNSKKQEAVVCGKVDILIDHDKDIFFLDASDIKSLLINSFGDSVKGDRIKNIAVGRIEKVIEENDFVQDAESWLDAKTTTCTSY